MTKLGSGIPRPGPLRQPRTTTFEASSKLRVNAELYAKLELSQAERVRARIWAMSAFITVFFQSHCLFAGASSLYMIGIPNRLGELFTSGGCKCFEGPEGQLGSRHAETSPYLHFSQGGTSCRFFFEVGVWHPGNVLRTMSDSHFLSSLVWGVVRFLDDLSLPCMDHTLHQIL